MAFLTTGPAYFRRIVSLAGAPRALWAVTLDVSLAPARPACLVRVPYLARIGRHPRGARFTQQLAVVVCLELWGQEPHPAPFFGLIRVNQERRSTSSSIFVRGGNGPSIATPFTSTYLARALRSNSQGTNRSHRYNTRSKSINAG